MNFSPRKKQKLFGEALYDFLTPKSVEAYAINRYRTEPS
jgi:hypothetical protein